jgi:peptide chain release factor 1
VLGRDVVDELQHVDRLADARAAEQADLAALGEGADQVDDLDAGLEQLHRGRELVELRRQLVYRASRVRLDRAAFVDRAAQHVHDAAQRAVAHGHRDGRSRALHLHAAAQPVGGAEGDAAHHAVAQLLLDFEGESPFDQPALGRFLENECVVDVGHRFARKLDVGDCADALNDGAVCLCLCHIFSDLDGGCAADDF